MEKIFVYSVRILKEQGAYSWNRNSFTKGTINVLKSNDKYTVLDDFSFTKLENKKSDYNSYSVIDKPSISVRWNDRLLDNGVFYTLYSTKPVKPEAIKKQINNYVKSKFSWLLSGLELSIIK